MADKSNQFSSKKLIDINKALNNFSLNKSKNQTDKEVQKEAKTENLKCSNKKSFDTKLISFEKFIQKKTEKKKENNDSLISNEMVTAKPSSPKKINTSNSDSSNQNTSFTTDSFNNKINIQTLDNFPTNKSSSNQKLLTSGLNLNSLPKFKLSTKKIFGNEGQNMRVENQNKSNYFKSKKKSNSFTKSSSKNLSNVNPPLIKTASIKNKKESNDEDKKFLNFQTPKIIKHLIENEEISKNSSYEKNSNKSLNEIQLDSNQNSTTSGLKVSFDEETRQRSNSDSNTRLNKKPNFIRSIRKSFFAHQDDNCVQNTANRFFEDNSQNSYNKEVNKNKSFDGNFFSNKRLSNKMMGMLNKGKNQLAIVRSHSLESNKFSAKKKSQIISKSQTKLVPSLIDPYFDEYKFLPLKWSFSQFYNSDNELNEYLIYVKFFEFYRCYDLIPTSSKLVVFDTQISVKKAFAGLVAHGVKAAPLWDNNKQTFVGMLTISFFINILIDQYENKKLESTLFEEQKLDSWKNFYSFTDQQENLKTDRFISIDPDSTVFDAIRLLIKYKIHRLPVFDPLTQNVIYVLTHKRILKFLHTYYPYLPMPKFLNKTISELKIGTFEGIETVSPNTSLIDALNKFIKKNISSLPIVDNSGKLLDVFCKFDLFNLAANKMYSNLDIKIEKALEQRVDSNCELLITCYAHSSLNNVIDLFVTNESHRLIIINESDIVIGIICLSDVLKFLITYNENDTLESKDEVLNIEENQNLFENDKLDLNEEKNSKVNNQVLPNKKKDGKKKMNYTSKEEIIEEINENF